MPPIRAVDTRPVPDPVPDPTPVPTPLDPAEAAKIAWPWLHANCAPSTWTRFAASIAVRQPMTHDWPTTT